MDRARLLQHSFAIYRAAINSGFLNNVTDE
jgi:hypothetical protein